MGVVFSELVSAAVAVLIGLLAARLFPAGPRRSGTWRLTGFAAVAAFLLVAAIGFGNSRVPETGPLLLALAVVVATGASARRWPAPAGPRRTAILAQPESPTRSRLLRWLLRSATAFLAVVVVGAWLTAGPTPEQFSIGEPSYVGSRGDYPGGAVAVAIVLVLWVLLIAVAWATQMVDRIPWSTTPQGRWDRELASARILRAGVAGIGVSAGLSGIAVGRALNGASLNAQIKASDLPSAAAHPALEFTQFLGSTLVVVSVAWFLVAVYALLSAPSAIDYKVAQHLGRA